MQRSSDLFILHTRSFSLFFHKVEEILEEMGLESVAFFRPSGLVVGRKKKYNNRNSKAAGSSGWSTIACRVVSSWVLPARQEACTNVKALGEAMVTVAVSTLEEAGPALARYEGESLEGLLTRKRQ